MREPLSEWSSYHLSIMAAFLGAMRSAWRVSEIQALVAGLLYATLHSDDGGGGDETPILSLFLRKCWSFI